MQRVDILERKIKTAKDLQSIVKTMKGLAAVSINQYEHAVDSISTYFSTIETGLQIILRNQPQIGSLFQTQSTKGEKKSIAIVFGSGQPMCGAFNEVVVKYFNSQWKERARESSGRIISIGHRITSHLERYGWKADHHFEMPSTLEKINEKVQSLAVFIQQWYSEEGFSQAHLFYNRPVSNAHYNPVSQQLLPVDIDWLRDLATKPWDSRSLPTYTMDAEALVSALIKQLLFVSIYKAFSESLSAENSSRLAAMQVAEKKITEMIYDLTKAYRNQRQANITEEILDIMASFEVSQDSQH